MAYSVEKEKGSSNFIIVDDDGEQLGESYGTRRAAIRQMGHLVKFEEEERKRKGEPKKNPEKTKSDEDDEEDE